MKTLSVELPEELHKELKKAALERDTTIKNLITDLIRKALNL